MTIGRAPECELLIDDTYASQQHARHLRQERDVVRRGSRLDERHVRERPETRGTCHGAARRQDPRGNDRAGAAPMRVVVGVATDIGRVRERNEDSYLVEPPLYAVADGMGGARGGAVASSLALDTVEELLRSGKASLAEMIRSANRAVFERSISDRKVSGMGTTLTATTVDEQRRAPRPRRRQPRLSPSSGRPPPTDGRPHPREPYGQSRRDHRRRGRHPPPPQRPDAQHRHRAGGRRRRERRSPASTATACCSAATASQAWSPNPRSKRSLETTPDPQEAADRLIKAANRAGGIDNITVVDPRHPRGSRGCQRRAAGKRGGGLAECRP